MGTYQIKCPNVDAVVIISDTHIGSKVGLWPDNYRTAEDNEIGQTKLSKVIWDVWLESQKEMAKYLRGKKYIIVLNGDIVEGIHHATTEIYTADKDDQVEAAKQVLRPLTDKAALTVMVRGTEVHVRNDENSISKSLGLLADPENEKKASFDKIWLKVNGHIIDVAHHMPTTSRSYLEAGAYSILMGNSRNNIARAGMELPTIFARAHRHLCGCFTDCRGLVVVTGAWQGMTRFGYKVASDSNGCFPTMAVLDFTKPGVNNLPTVQHFGREIIQTQTIEIIA